MNIPEYNISTILKKYRTNSQGEAPIYIKISMGNEKMELSINQFVEPKFWDSKTGRLNGGPKKVELNALIDKICTDHNKSIMQMFLSGIEANFDNIKKAVRGEELVKKYKLIEVVIEHNNSFEQLIGIKYSYGSYKNYKTTLRFLKEFIQYEYAKKDMPLTSIDFNFCEKFFVWLTTKKTSKQNGAYKHMQRLKKIINYATKMGYIQNSLIRNYALSFKKPVRSALTWEEIELIRKLKLKTATLENIRKIFLFQVFTGLSYSDVKALSKQHLYNGVDKSLWLKMERTKTKNTFTVPLLKPALVILNEFLKDIVQQNQPIFPVISNQKMNQNLKIIQELAGINKNLHSHLPRHTFATTVTLQSGIPLETVSKMLGHSKIAMTQIYAKVGELKIANDMEKLSKTIK